MSNRIKELDALRGIASISVVFFHLTYNTSLFKYGFYLGCMGVDLFFIISGFVILMTLENCKNWKDFLVSRFSRLFPAYWASVTLAAIIAFLFVKDFRVFYGIDRSFLPYQYLYNLTMVQYYFKIPDLDATYWTLIIELNFYFVMFILFLIKRISKIETIGSLTVLLILLFVLNHDYLIKFSFVKNMVMLIPLIKYFSLFFIGIILYKIKSEKLTLKRFLMSLLCLITQLFMFKYYYRNNISVSFVEYLLGLTFIYMLLAMFVLNKLNFIVNRVSIKLGELSYVLYLNHFLIGANVIALGLVGAGLHLYFSILITLVVVLIIAFSINRFIEKPALNFIRNKYNSNKNRNK